MSLQQGSFSITRYRIIGRQHRLTLAELNQNIHGFQAPPITLQKAARELDFGWVLPENPEIDDDADRSKSWDISDCLFEDGILLRFRIDRKTVSSQLQQALVKERWQQYKLAASRQPEGGDEPVRVLRKQILDEVKDELLQLSLPSISFVEAFWKDQDDVVYLFSQSKMARETFEELFRKTFGEALNLSLFRILPPMMGLASQSWQALKGESKLLDQLLRTLPARSGDLSVS